jgi:hypothetical protein
MNKHLDFIFLIFICLVPHICTAQKEIKSKLLSHQEHAEVIDKSIIQEFNINIQIYLVYEIRYQGIVDYLVLCESRDQVIQKTKDTINKQLKAVLLRRGSSGIEQKVWEINDLITSGSTEEKSIVFLTKFMDFQDFDLDGYVDYTLIYASRAMNDFMDGRLKIAMLQADGSKVFIRHQNAVLDHDRQTQIDKSFYTLDRTWQSAIRKRMLLLEKEGRAIFPDNWQTAMKANKTIINERQ